MLKSRSALTSLSEEEEDCLDEDVLVTLLKLAPKTRDSQVYKRYDVAPLGLKNGRAQYGENQRDREDGKNKRGGENGKGKKGGGGYCRNEVKPMVGESSDSDTSIYYHIIYRCYQGLMVLG